MRRATDFRAPTGRCLAAAFSMAVSLAAFGAADPPPAPASVAAPSPASVPPPTGRLWREAASTDGRGGLEAASLGSAPPLRYAPADSRRVYGVWPDGRQFASASWDARTASTTLVLVDTATGATVAESVFHGAVAEIRPSPVDKDVVLMWYQVAPGASPHAVVWKVSTARVLAVPGSGLVDWLPDGRTLFVDDEGRLLAAAPGDDDELVGQLRVPPALQLVDLFVSPTGDRIALDLVRSTTARGDYDLWTSRLDGGGLQRVTRTNETYYARWSPDGRYLAFDVDAGRFCRRAGCVRPCGLWVVAREAREVSPGLASAGASGLRPIDSRGERRRLGCDLVQWTP